MTTRRGLLAATALSSLLPRQGRAQGQAQGQAQNAAPTPAAPAPELLVEKKVFEFANYRTRGGANLAAGRIGYQTAGTLNAAGDNAVLIEHFFTGNSHAFGRYAAGEAPGYWDAIIGPGKPIDTNRFFVVAADCLANLNVRDARTITTGPASVNPATGRPYGMDFPVVSIRDFVEVQKLLLESLGVKKLALVAGGSMGSLQVVEWAAAYPEWVERAMPAIGTGEIDAWMLGWLDIWEAPIRMDPNWRNGEYYAQGRQPPLQGLTEALRIVTLHSRDRAWAREFGRRPVEGQDPARRIGDRFAVEQWLEDAAAARARVSDANSFLYLTRANQLFLNEYDSTEAALSRSRARWLLLPSVHDRVFPVEYGRELAETLRRLNRPVEVVELKGPLGHLEGVVGIAQAADAIRALLAH
ncbi:E22 family MetX-like putative esterase [Pseudoroseomonas ludipueritiae]|uniref:Probable acyltransferase n=1 Tax=Pseudoroseomonas ludipueritiae TaxID=198093 RepID=A0ABR7R3I0_9PROT|nr:homoserine O-acetyltransferase [Pseudoroseomonas ludipueritiae]MBC9176283.1 homoserine O-acetyltransferase [Pseudoroseomonas ludipueritiae]MCG7361608.1 homoserine O-acetyltransferase [Roseomonas sp. ACRSG]